MVEGYRRSRRRTKKKLLGNHQKCWIWGRNAVLETLRSGKWPIVSLHVDREMVKGLADWLAHRAGELKTDLHWETADSLRKLCQAGDHQGFAARMSEFPYSDPSLMNEVLVELSPRIVVCDGIQDPFNFGAIVRTAEALGFQAIVIARSGQVGVTSHVARASAGAVNHLPIIRVDDLMAMVRQIQEHGVKVVAASEKAACELGELDLSGAVAVVVGNEGYGVRPELLASCDLRARIPIPGQTQSLNAAVAAGIFLYETVRQRHESTH